MTYHLKTALLALATTLPTDAIADWNGAYVGFSLGSNVTSELLLDDGVDTLTVEAESRPAFGTFVGYSVKSADFVFGGELDFSIATRTRLEEEVLTFDLDVFDLKGRAGYAVDNILLYGVAGLSRIYIGAGRANGINFGVGAAYDLGNNVVIGAEYLARRTTLEDDQDVDVHLDTLSLRAAYRF